MTKDQPLRVVVLLAPDFIVEHDLSLAIGRAGDLVPDYLGAPDDNVLYVRGTDGILKELLELLRYAIADA